MIDFRFHLVSIVSIFIALAVGIVLGAGPLQNSIGTTLTDQLQQLRTDKDDLRQQLNDSNTSLAAAEDYANLVASAALAGRLRDRSVVLLTGRDTAGSFASQVTQALQQAGATVTTTVTLGDSFTDPDLASQRLEAATTAASDLDLSTAGGDSDALLGTVLARLLVRTSASAGTSGTSGTAHAGAAAALQALTRAGVQSTSKTPARAELAVVLGDSLTGDTANVASESATLVALVSALRSGSEGVVVADGTPATVTSPQVTTTVVAQVRSSKALAASVSSVDHANSVSGAGLVAIALAEQAAGGVGHYGTSSGATSDVPASGQ